MIDSLETRIGKLKMKRKRNNFMIPVCRNSLQIDDSIVINFIQSCYKEDSILLSRFDLSILDSRKVYLLTDV